VRESENAKSKNEQERVGTKHGIIM